MSTEEMAATSEASPRQADAITTEVIRHSLNSAANQMKRALIRTAFSPIIYEVLDFAVAIFDERMRLLAQAPTLPLFMGRLGFCVEAAVEAVGGPEALEPGDVILYNYPYGTGSHPQDAALVSPVFHEGALFGYIAVKAHWLDIGAKDPYSTDTVDVFQEGTIFPGVKLLSRGELVSDIYRIALANSRVPRMVAGDINAELVALRTGESAFLRVVERFGIEIFRSCVERIFDHGEAIVRSYFARIPDGEYIAKGMLDDDGLSEEPIEFEVVLSVDGSDVTVDFSRVPSVRPGPINSSMPKTVAASRIALGMLAGAHDPPTEGHFRPMRVITRPGSMFHALPPHPTFIGSWAATHAINALYRAVASAMPEAVPASSGGDIASITFWGAAADQGVAWVAGSPHMAGQGGNATGDGANAVMHITVTATRCPPVEVWEAKSPILVESIELAQNSGGAGRHRGGLGVDFRYRMLADAWTTSVVDGTRHEPSGLAGGGPGRSNIVVARYPDGHELRFGKATRLALPKGTTVEVHTGGGGGYGIAADRDPRLVLEDVVDGYISEEHARRNYPHAFASDAE